MGTEADTCRKYVLPELYAAGWNDDQIRKKYKGLKTETSTELDDFLPSILDRAFKGEISRVQIRFLKALMPLFHLEILGIRDFISRNPA